LQPNQQNFTKLWPCLRLCHIECRKYFPL